MNNNGVKMMKNNDDVFNLINGLLNTLGNGKPQAESDEQRGIFINRAGGKNLEKIIITNVVDICQKHSDKIRSQKSAPTQTANDSTSSNRDASASDLEKNTRQESEEFTSERTRCFDEALKPNLLLSNITPTDTANIIEIMVPGLEKENIDLSVDDERITVTTKKAVSSSDAVSTFSVFDATATFEIDKDKFNIEELKAEHKNGVLTIIVPFKEKPKSNSRKIEIN